LYSHAGQDRERRAAPHPRRTRELAITPIPGRKAETQAIFPMPASRNFMPEHHDPAFAKAQAAPGVGARTNTYRVFRQSVPRCASMTTSSEPSVWPSRLKS